ncbi:hypothetical protein BDV24DRAFT_143809 [Aspergillus arachidicola]|uniref:Uncharacterized protein n=1 Tax=Aspergillus arachidicola TaxID=656916 RepID=A0A5N6XTG0_9EURO|nr:hypothetical protein BDV24DRAFT_143809 [Aspergillus arachidicola]
MISPLSPIVMTPNRREASPKHPVGPPQSQACPQPLRIRCQDKSRRTKGPDA